MEFTNLLNAKSRHELREWLINNHDKEKECWVIVKRGRPVDDGTFWYIDSVEEAMCFGWIDSTTKKMDNGVTAQRLAPRRKGSLWSELNKERCRRMERLGLMTDAGRAVLPDMSPKGFVIDGDIEKALKADSGVWSNFQKFPPRLLPASTDTSSHRTSGSIPIGIPNRLSCISFISTAPYFLSICLPSFSHRKWRYQNNSVPFLKHPSSFQ